MQLKQFTALCSLIAGSFTGLLAQGPGAPSPATQVMATLTVKDGVARADIMKIMPGEVRDTVQLYLDGKIQQWFSRADGKGVIFILNCKSVEEAKSVLEALPLAQSKLAAFEYTALAPLKPLGLLIAPAAK
jgi:hypothetical protein